MADSRTSGTHTSKVGRRLGKVFLAAIWGVAILFVGALGLEGFLKIRWERKGPPGPAEPTPVFTRLEQAYQPFTVQHINPFYLFFFPFDADRRAAINNDVCSVDPDGFRGPGPRDARGRKLAFLVGGSAAFGHFSSDDSTTITGYLNQAQDEFMFVNAGVPSWNSFQELARLANQILDFSPALVIAYDGGNDIALAIEYWQKGLDYPAGTPESFDKLYALVGDIRGDRLYAPRDPFRLRFFPRLTRSIEFHVLRRRTSPSGAADSPARPRLPNELIRATAERYVSNLTHMQSLTQASGGRFVAIFQSAGNLHSSAPPHRLSDPITQTIRSFRDRVFSGHTSLVEHLDFSTVLEDFEGDTPWRGQPGHPDLDDEVIFVDGLHLSDRGNRFVAEKILAYLDQSAAKGATDLVE